MNKNTRKTRAGKDQGASTLDELLVAAAELDDDELRRVLLGYRDGESVERVLARVLGRKPPEPEHQQLLLEESAA